MAVTLDYQKLPTQNHVTWSWLTAGGVTNIDLPTATELNAGLNISAAVSLSDTDFGNQASNTNSDPSFADEGNVQTRGASQYGGSVSMYYPKQYRDASNVYSNAYDALKGSRTPGLGVIRIDGDTKTQSAFAAGQYVNVYQVTSVAEQNTLGGEDAQRRTVTWLNAGGLAIYTVVSSGAATLALPGGALTVGVGDQGRLDATLNGRTFYGGDFVSSDPEVVEVTTGGFWRALDTGSATITYSYSGLTATQTVTVS